MMNKYQIVLFLLFTKHFIVDFLGQTSYQYLNKGKLGHPGGILHASLHGMATYLILMFFVAPYSAFCFAFAESGAHYWIDYFKVNINKSYGWKPDNSECFWWLLGFDQYLHSLCYFAIAYYI